MTEYTLKFNTPDGVDTITLLALNLEEAVGQAHREMHITYPNGGWRML